MGQTVPTKFEAISEEEAQEIAAKLDVGSRVRKFTGPFTIFLALVAAGMSVFHLYTTLFGFFDAPIQRSYFLIFVAVLGYALYPARASGAIGERRLPPIWDIGLMLVGAWAGAYIIINFEDIVMNMGNPSQTDIVMGCIAIVLVLELCRRAAGPVLASICVIFLLYALFGNPIPGSSAQRVSVRTAS